MIGGIIGGALSAVGGIFGGLKASQAMKNVRNSLKEQRLENKNWYDRRYDEDATQRADAQAALSQVQEEFRERNRAAAGAAAVGGSTEESVAATKAANAQAMADAASVIAVNGEMLKDGLEREYRDKDAQMAAMLNEMEVGKAHGVAQAAQGVAQAGANIADLIDNGSNR